MFTLTLLALLAADPAASDWNRFRGPNGAGTALSTGLPAEFGPAKNVVWKVALPPGYSSPIVSAGRIFVTAAENDKLFTIALDLKSGAEQWRRESPRDRKEKLDPGPLPAEWGGRALDPRSGLPAHGRVLPQGWRECVVGELSAR